MNKVCRLIFLLFSLLLLHACAAAGKPRIAPVPVEDRSVETAADGQARYPATGKTDTPVPQERPFAGNRKPRENTDTQPVLVALLEDAQAKMQSGDIGSAAATLERALRLDAKNALLWHRLGRLRLQQKNWQQAINLAKKSNSLAAGNYQLQAANWKLISQANSRAGHKDAAKLAAERAGQLEQAGN